MSTAKLRRAAKELVDNLPDDKLKAAVEFLNYLEHRACEEATEELMRIPGLLDDLKAAEQEHKEGKGVNWRDVRKTGTHVRVQQV